MDTGMRVAERPQLIRTLDIDRGFSGISIGPPGPALELRADPPAQIVELTGLHQEVRGFAYQQVPRPG
jgi:hypothetical protein